MKRLLWLSAFIFLFAAGKAQTDKLIKITGTKFPYDIMQQWINDYTKIHPDIHFQLSKSLPADSADLVIAAHGFRTGELKENQTAIAVTRYAQLPIVNSKRSDLKTLTQEGFTQKDLQSIYFNTNAKKESKKTGDSVTVYKREKNICASRSFAENITGSQSDIAGTLVMGDDRALTNAVKKDINGISYNSLNLIYNLTTRKVTDSIAVVPIDLNENGKIDADENIYGTLDEVLSSVSKASHSLIIQDNVNVVFDTILVNKNTLDFVKWILSNGQKYNRQYGFLNLDEAVVLREQQTIDNVTKDKALTRNN